MTDGLLVASEVLPSNGRMSLNFGKTATINSSHCDLSELTIEHVGRSLSKQCRFNGHGNDFYSVAQHSVLVSWLVKPEYALQALLHDGPEALTGDVTRPVKYLPELQGFRDVEACVDREFFRHFGLPHELHPSVKQADVAIVAWEAYHLFTPAPSYARHDSVPSSFQWVPLAHDRAYSLFMNRYYKILDTTI